MRTDESFLNGVVIVKNIKAITVILFVCVSVFAVCVKASLYNDPAAMTGFTNRTSFSITMSGSVLKADVEYAVFAPGTYPGNNLAGDDEYIYAYQVFDSLKSSVAVDFFSVEITSGVTVNTIYDDETYGYSPETAVAPSISNLFAQSAGFIFAGQSLNPRNWSDVLIFSSTHSPAIGFGTVSGGGLCGMGSLATPSVLPEPATILFIAPAIFILRIKKMTKVK